MRFFPISIVCHVIGVCAAIGIWFIFRHSPLVHGRILLVIILDDDDEHRTVTSRYINLLCNVCFDHFRSMYSEPSKLGEHQNMAPSKKIHTHSVCISYICLWVYVFRFIVRFTYLLLYFSVYFIVVVSVFSVSFRNMFDQWTAHTSTIHLLSSNGKLLVRHRHHPQHMHTHVSVDRIEELCNAVFIVINRSISLVISHRQ